MRKLNEVSKEIETIINESGRISDCNYKRKIQKRVEFLKQMQFYLLVNSCCSTFFIKYILIHYILLFQFFVILWNKSAVYCILI